LNRLLLLALLVVGAGAAGAEALSDPERPAEAMPVAGTSGNYAGVTPGRNSRNPLPSAPAGSPRLIWTGFQSTPTGSRVFLQTTSPITYDIQQTRASKSGHSSLVVVLRNCRIHTANNQRRLDTRAFPTPVRGFIAKQKRRDVELRITLRERATATPTTEAGPDGTQFVLLDFPPGKAELVESPTLADAPGEGVLSLPPDEDALLEAKGRRGSKAAAPTEPRSSFSGYGSTSGAAPSQPTGQGTPAYNPWNPSGLGVDETPAHTIRK
jgi:hypothetical protein